MAVLATLASILAQHRDSLKGNVKFLFQPAEERVGGAKQMIQEGALECPRVDACAALHLWNHLEVGKVGVNPDVIFASADEFRIVIKGRGGHAAHPEWLIDPTLVSAQAINALHHIVSRNVAPLKSGVLSISTIHAGTAFNIIPDEVEMKGTVRAFDADTRKTILGRIEEVLKGVTSAAGASYTFEDTLHSPVIVNDPEIVALVKGAADRVLGEGSAIEVEPTTGGDDMAYFMEQVPGCYFVVGAKPKDRPVGPHHSATFDFDEEALKVGLKVMAAFALDYLA